MKRIWEDIKDNKILRLFLIIFCIGFITGVVIAYTYNKDYYFDLSSYNKSIINKIQEVKVDKKDFFLFILLNKLKTFLIYFLIVFTFLGMPYTLYLILKFGFNLGFIFAIMWYQYGIKGIIISLSSQLPHGLIYIPVYILIFYKGYTISKTINIDKHYERRKLIILKESIVRIIILFILLTLGSYIEAYLGYYLIKNIVKILK